MVAPVLPVLGIDHAHFCVVMVVLIELGMITPPLGLNLFVIQGLRPGTSLSDVAIGSLPFTVILVAGTVALAAFPRISLALPNVLGN